MTDGSVGVDIDELISIDEMVKRSNNMDHKLELNYDTLTKNLDMPTLKVKAGDTIGFMTQRSKSNIVTSEISYVGNDHLKLKKSYKAEVDLTLQGQDSLEYDFSKYKVPKKAKTGKTQIMIRVMTDAAFVKVTINIDITGADAEAACKPVKFTNYDKMEEDFVDKEINMSFDIDRLENDETTYRIDAYPGDGIGLLFSSMDKDWLVTNQVIGLDSPVVSKGCLSGTAIADVEGYTNWYQNYNLREKLADGSDIVDNAVTFVSFSFSKEDTKGEKKLIKSVVFQVNYGPIPVEPEIDPNAPVYVTESNMNSLFEIITYAADVNHFEVVDMSSLHDTNGFMTIKAAAYDKMGILFYTQSPDDDVQIPQLTED